ncbi:2-keto-4-pentenoate hydratase/2-oxohepta-3-ene-1,7-dioic acid hydratase in catechol pathway [Paucibacter oligotrophus]|uniref:2-keto-4-pentenoate hydratase/2-oxohepta-3-ene-1,7-dioic acid hydratase in catechol pathway n=1 Tax=Roseateles oligotrophus TaxID=1769250 RepID=A0A840LDJ6_9BURK|nr:fumarylacetoacetate hydrolase family protein [Roseateles oligotrophus]MBB4846240.1 2-keto-4-pentenoate hydratase/2-oxohepta-3-ene-1,7-dioic acid hydratase in catechol pathway [Roseateles oligotrophus]
MKLVNFLVNGETRMGVLDDGQVVDVLALHEAQPFLDGAAVRAMSDTASVITHWVTLKPLFEDAVARSRKTTGARPRMEDVTLTAPIRPSTILCSGSNYLSHNQEKANADTSGKEPEFFVKTGDCVIGSREQIIHDPLLTSKLDGEVELAVVIGKPGRHIAVEDALDHVFGYTIVNDVTARDRQVRRRPDGSYWYELGRGKLFDTSAPMGPCIVTRDELPDPQRITVRSWVNGELRQISSTSQMIWTVAELIHFFSINMTLRPGMVIITGTPSGTAWSTDHELGGHWVGTNGMVPAPGYLKKGDVIVCEIDGIGRLENAVAA